VRSGYAGGPKPNPTYQEICTGKTGHAEVIEIAFDPAVITYRQLLEVFFSIHDPTTLDRQGNDVGTQYRSVIFTHTDAQTAVGRAVITELQEAGLWPGRFVTQVQPAPRFFEAEAYHQEYFAKNPSQGYCRVVVAPKVAKFRQKFLPLLRG
jgi:peptide-methionine (S)-S-oxide reductase